MNVPFWRRSTAGAEADAMEAARRTYAAMWLSSTGKVPYGYSRLIDRPEIRACVNAIANPIATSTIYLMSNDKAGDKRVRGTLSRRIDIDPWPGMATRQSWIDWIVTTMLTTGDGNAMVLPHYTGMELDSLEPMPEPSMNPTSDGKSYTVMWRGGTFSGSDILHFRLHSDLSEPWRGTGYKVTLEQLTESLVNTDSLRSSLSSPDYKPPLLVFVNSDTDLSDDEKREYFRSKYLEDTDTGKPWILPADLVKIETVKPLSLTDLAIKDTVELDKKAIAAMFGVPTFLLGLGQFNQQEYNLFVSTVVVPIASAIEKELTLKLLINPYWYFQFNRRRLYSYDLKTLTDIYLALSDRGYVDGDETREVVNLEPCGLKEKRCLENYIPEAKAGEQKKLIQEAESDGERETNASDKVDNIRLSDERSTDRQ